MSVKVLIVDDEENFVELLSERLEARGFKVGKAYNGSDAISMKKPHVAVQLDPEDDLIIDPEGAKSYFEGLLKPLGAKVFVYWGSPGTFLEDMRSNVSPAFLNDSSIARSES